MTWLSILLGVALVVAIVSVLWLQPRHGRQISHTNLLGVARAVLIIGALIVAVLAYYFRSR